MYTILFTIKRVRDVDYDPSRLIFCRRIFLVRSVDSVLVEICIRYLHKRDGDLFFMIAQ